MPPTSRTRGTPETEHWVSVAAVASHLGVAQDSVYRWIETKHLPAHRIGKLWKFKLSEVDEWVRTGGTNDDTGTKSRARRTGTRRKP